MRKEFKPIQLGDIEIKDICLKSFVLRDNSLVFNGIANSIVSESKVDCGENVRHEEANNGSAFNSSVF